MLACSSLSPNAGCSTAASASISAVATMTPLRNVTPSFLRATRSAVTKASRYATPLRTSTRVAIGSSVIGAHRGPASPSGKSARDHTLEAAHPYLPHFRFLLDDLSAMSPEALAARTTRSAASCSWCCARRAPGPGC